MIDKNDAPLGFIAVPEKSVDDPCKGCHFYHEWGDGVDDFECTQPNGYLNTNCSKHERNDEQSVIFIKKETVVETIDIKQEPTLRQKSEYESYIDSEIDKRQKQIDKLKIEIQSLTDSLEAFNRIFEQ